jgi:hypothetical protein
MKRLLALLVIAAAALACTPSDNGSSPGLQSPSLSSPSLESPSLESPAMESASPSAS